MLRLRNWSEVLRTVIPRNIVLVMNILAVHGLQPLVSDHNQSMDADAVSLITASGVGTDALVAIPGESEARVLLAGVVSFATTIDSVLLQPVSDILVVAAGFLRNLVNRLLALHVLVEKPLPVVPRALTDVRAALEAVSVDPRQKSMDACSQPLGRFRDCQGLVVVDCSKLILVSPRRLRVLVPIRHCSNMVDKVIKSGETKKVNLRGAP